MNIKVKELNERLNRILVILEGDLDQKVQEDIIFIKSLISEIEKDNRVYIEYTPQINYKLPEFIFPIVKELYPAAYEDEDVSIIIETSSNRCIKIKMIDENRLQIFLRDYDYGYNVDETIDDSEETLIRLHGEREEDQSIENYLYDMYENVGRPHLNVNDELLELKLKIILESIYENRYN